MEINPQNVCEVLRAIRILCALPTVVLDETVVYDNATIATIPERLYSQVLLKTAHHIEEHNKLPSLKQIRRWQAAALKINES